MANLTEAHTTFTLQHFPGTNRHHKLNTHTHSPSSAQAFYVRVFLERYHLTSPWFYGGQVVFMVLPLLPLLPLTTAATHNNPSSSDLECTPPQQPLTQANQPNTHLSTGHQRPLVRMATGPPTALLQQQQGGLHSCHPLGWPCLCSLLPHPLVPLGPHQHHRDWCPLYRLPLLL